MKNKSEYILIFHEGNKVHKVGPMTAECCLGVWSFIDDRERFTEVNVCYTDGRIADRLHPVHEELQWVYSQYGWRNTGSTKK